MTRTPSRMALRLRLLFLLFACALYLPVVHGMERAGDAASLYELERYADAVTALETNFLSLIDAAPGEERFDLYWTYNHLTGSWIQVEYLQAQFELSVAAEPYSDEASMRTTLRDQAEFVRWELGHAIDDLETVPDGRSLNHLWLNEAVRSLLFQVRTTVDRLWTDQCAYMPCAAAR